jgi:ABC-type lipoprotein export system ATPase subunit
MQINSTKGLYIRNMHFTFLPGLSPFFNGVSVQFMPGVITFVKGKNGSGKTTLFRILHGDINNLEQFQATFELDGQEYKVINNKVAPEYTGQVQQVVQNINSMLADQLTVEQNLQMAQLTRVPSLRSLPKLSELPMILRDLGIKRHDYVAQLSGGQRQILAIAMMLQKPTRVLLLDEPTAALDTKNADLVMKAIQEIAHKQQLVVLVISHDKELVEQYARHEYTEIHVADNGTRSFVKIPVGV